MRAHAFVSHPGNIDQDADTAVLIRVAPRLPAVQSSNPREALTETLQDIARATADVAETFGARVVHAENGTVLLVFLCDGEALEARALRAIEAARAIKTRLTPPGSDQPEGDFADAASEAPVLPRAPACFAVYTGRWVGPDAGADPIVLTHVEHEGMELIRLCPPGDICMSQRVQRLIQARYNDRPVGLIGRTDSRRAGASLLGAPRPSLPGSHVPPFCRPGMTARAQELSRLEDLWASVVRGDGSRIVSVLAPPSMGRTRLLEAFLATLNPSDVNFVVTSCEEASAWAPYHPFVEIITQLIGATPDDDDDTVALRLMLKTRDAVAATAGWESTREHEPDIIELSTVIGELLGIDMASRERYVEPFVLRPDELRQRTFYCLMRFLVDLSAELPLVLSIEHIHLADSATLDLLAYLGTTLRGRGRVLLLCSGDAAFTDLHPDWGKDWVNHEVLTLGKLPAHEMAGVVEPLAKGGGEDLVQRIVRQARGRPGVAALIAEAWQAWNEAERSSLALETLDDQEDQTTVTGPSNGAVRSGGREDIVDVTDSLSATAEDEAPGRHEGEGAGTPDAGASPPREHWRAPASQTATGDGATDAVEKDDPAVDYFFEGPGDSTEDIREGSSFVMAYRDDDGEGGERGGTEDTGIDDLFLSTPEPLGPLQHLLPGEIWAHRLDRLSDAARRVLILASISGSSFRGEQVVSQWRMDGGDPGALSNLLAELQAAGFLERRLEARSWQVSWRFRSTLLQKVVYDSTPLVERHRLHRQLARLIMEDQVGGRTRATYALVGYHFDRGDDPDRAFRYHVMAAKKARRTLALKEAEHLLSRARTLMRQSGYPDGGTEMTAVHRMLGEILGLLNEPKQAINELETALEFARVRGDAKRHCEVLMSLCDVLEGGGERRRALEVAEQAHRLARKTNNARLAVESLRRLGWERVRAGRLEAARKAMEQAVEVAVGSADPELMVTAFDALGGFHYVTGNYALATRGYEGLLDAIKDSIRHRGPGAAFPVAPPKA